jgi:hypothetical protein
MIFGGSLNTKFLLALLFGTIYIQNLALMASRLSPFWGAKDVIKYL